MSPIHRFTDVDGHVHNVTVSEEVAAVLAQDAEAPERDGDRANVMHLGAMLPASAVSDGADGEDYAALMRHVVPHTAWTYGPGRMTHTRNTSATTARVSDVETWAALVTCDDARHAARAAERAQRWQLWTQAFTTSPVAARIDAMLMPLALAHGASVHALAEREHDAIVRPLLDAARVDKRAQLLDRLARGRETQARKRAAAMVDALTPDDARDIARAIVEAALPRTLDGEVDLT